MNAEFGFIKDKDTLKIIDWSDYDCEWCTNMNGNLNLPDDVTHISFIRKPIQSVYLYPIQKYVMYNDTMYSNTEKPIPISGFKTGSISFKNFIRSDIIDENNQLSCTFTCSWIEKKIINKAIKRTKRTESLTVFTEYYNTSLWDNLSTMNITLSNYTGNYLLLNFTIPKSATAYTIDISSTNHTASYEKYEYLYTLNESHSLHYYDMIDADLMSYYGLVPFGPNRFYLPYDTDYNISVNIYTPFENKIYNYSNINIKHINETDTDDGNMEYICFCFGFVIAVYYIYKGV